MFSKDTPCLNDEMIRWLIAHKINTSKGSVKIVYDEIINFARIEPTCFMNIVNEMIINGCVTKEDEPIYAPKSKNVLEICGYHSHYFLTKKGKKQLLSGWEFASSLIPKDLYAEAIGAIKSISSIYEY